MSRYRWWWLALLVWPALALLDAAAYLFVGVNLFPPGDNDTRFAWRSVIGLGFVIVAGFVSVGNSHIKDQR